MPRWERDHSSALLVCSTESRRIEEATKRGQGGDPHVSFRVVISSCCDGHGAAVLDVRSASSSVW